MKQNFEKSHNTQNSNWEMQDCQEVSGAPRPVLAYCKPNKLWLKISDAHTPVGHLL